MIRDAFRIVHKRIKRWWNGPANVSAIDFLPYALDKEVMELITIGNPLKLSMELLDSYITFRNEGHDAAEAKQNALREWDL